MKEPTQVGVLAPENLPYQMFLLVQQMTKRFQAILRPHGITPLHWGVLSCLWREDGLRTSEIARRLEQLGGTITVGLDAMQKRGLLERRVHGSDKRITEVFLTRNGRALQSVLEPQARALIEEIFSGLSQEERQRFAAQVAGLREHLR